MRCFSALGELWNGVVIRDGLVEARLRKRHSFAQIVRP
jgi:hypothetical protein